MTMRLVVLVFVSMLVSSLGRAQTDTGAIRVIFEPAEVIAQGATWQVSGGSAKQSGGGGPDLGRSA